MMMSCRLDEFHVAVARVWCFFNTVRSKLSVLVSCAILTNAPAASNSGDAALTAHIAMRGAYALLCALQISCLRRKSPFFAKITRAQFLWKQQQLRVVLLPIMCVETAQCAQLAQIVTNKTWCVFFKKKLLSYFQQQRVCSTAAGMCYETRPVGCQESQHVFCDKLTQCRQLTMSVLFQIFFRRSFHKTLF